MYLHYCATMGHRWVKCTKRKRGHPEMYLEHEIEVYILRSITHIET